MRKCGDLHGETCGIAFSRGYIEIDQGCPPGHRTPRVGVEQRHFPLPEGASSMGSTTSTISYFILEVFDREQWCPVLQARFEVPDLAVLHIVLGEQADDDPDFQCAYTLDSAELAAVVAVFAVRFDPTLLQLSKPDIWLFRINSVRTVPYLVHTGYELPLLLDGRKKLAFMDHLYPPMTFVGEERFEQWVAKEMLHREEVIEPFDPPTKKYQGFRRV
jgi:hypothetical protein